jgi:alkylated DNA repair protein alkB family protein 4
MNTTRACGCKSFRSCFQCEPELGIVSLDPAQEKIDASKEKVHTFCTKCQRIFPGWDISNCGSHPGEGSVFPGIQFFHEFVSAEEEADLVRDLDSLPWDLSQSGRRKQNFGPRANFKKQKTKPGNFAGFPICTKFIQDRFSSVSEYLEDYRTVEQCSIEYKPETGSCIEPHIDDVWVWGERIVQLNLLSDSVLTFFPYLGGDDRYNLSDVKTYPQITDPSTGHVRFNPFKQKLVAGKLRQYFPTFRFKSWYLLLTVKLVICHYAKKQKSPF